MAACLRGESLRLPKRNIIMQVGWVVVGWLNEVVVGWLVGWLVGWWLVE